MINVNNTFYENKYLTKEQLQCPCCRELKLHKFFLKCLLPILEEYGKPIKVNSCYRCPIHNKDIGGIKNSYHTQGMAIDIAYPDIVEDRYRLINLFTRKGLDGGWAVGLYSNFIHFDIRNNPTFFRGAY